MSWAALRCGTTNTRMRRFTPFRMGFVPTFRLVAMPTNPVPGKTCKRT
jgi:hypothetical protein